MGLPTQVRKFFGHALDFAQKGSQHVAAKPLQGFGGAGVIEVVENDAGGTYRAVYTVKFEEVVFVLHCFQKRDHNAQGTYEPHSRPAESRRGADKGAEKWQDASLTALTSSVVQAMFSPTWVCAMPPN